MKTAINITIIAFTALLLCSTVHAETEVIRVTDNGYADILPSINGNYLVWQGYQDGDWEIFLYDIANALTTQITDNSYNDISVQTDGNYIAWIGMNTPGGNIFLYDINSGLVTELTSNDSIKSPPQVADGNIVWASQGVNKSILPGEIKLFETDTGKTSTISAQVDSEGNLDDNTPVIRNNKVVWVQTGLDQTKTTLFIYDIATGQVFPAPLDFTIDNGFTPGGNLSISTIFDGQDREIFLNHHFLKINEQVTDNNIEDTYPRIHGNHSVWVGGQGADQEIYLGVSRFLVLITPGDGLASYKNDYPLFKWEGTGYVRYKIQFSSKKNFIEKFCLTFPEPDSMWLFDPTFTVKKEYMQINRLRKKHQPIYWRILAQDEFGNEKVSQTRNFLMNPKKEH